MNLKGRNFLTLKDFTPEEILYLLDLSAELKAKKNHSTGAKGSTQTNKKNKLGLKRKEQKGNRRLPWSGVPDSPVHQGASAQTLHLRVFQAHLRYNSPDCPVCHRTVRDAAVPYFHHICSKIVSYNTCNMPYHSLRILHTPI